MYIFYFVLVVTYILALLARKTKDLSIEKKPEIILSLFLITLLIVVAGLVNDMGDTKGYMGLYQKILSYPNLNMAIEEIKGYEGGFISFLWGLGFISTNPQFMIFICALIVNFTNLWTIRKYSHMFELEIFMYITSSYYIVTMNGIRQCLAAAILFAATKYVIEGKFLNYFLITILMSTIHQSAIIMIPVYFIVRKESWTKDTMKLIILSILVLIFIQPIMETIFSISDSEKLQAYSNSMAREGGANPIRSLVAAVPVILSFIYRDKIKKEWRDSNVFINMSILNLIISVLSTYSWVFN